MKPMHEWESQEKLLDDYLHQEVKNCLEYVDFSYSKHEWDNIPGILPRFLNYFNFFGVLWEKILSKYIDGLAGFCKEVSERESTESIRDDLNYKYKTLIDQIKESRNTDLTEKTLINNKIVGLDTSVDKINSHIKEEQTLPLFLHYQLIHDENNANFLDYFADLLSLGEDGEEFE